MPEGGRTFEKDKSVRVPTLVICRRHRCAGGAPSAPVAGIKSRGLEHGHTVGLAAFEQIGSSRRSAHKHAAVQDIVVWKGDLYFVDKPEPNPEQLKGSLVAFAKNGVLQGTAYRYLAFH